MSNHWRQRCNTCSASYGAEEDGTLVSCACIPDHVYKKKVISLLEKILEHVSK